MLLQILYSAQNEARVLNEVKLLLSLVQIKIIVLTSFDARLSDVDESLQRHKNKNRKKKKNTTNTFWGQWHKKI